MAKVPDWILKSRSKWEYTGETRPYFAIEPSEDQESVWDYPRPPKLDHDTRHVIVKIDDVIIADTFRSIRILETASPPTFYLPPSDINFDALQKAHGTSICEWKGNARYWSVITSNIRLEKVGWSYPKPFDEFKEITEYLSFYPAHLECYVDW